MTRQRRRQFFSLSPFYSFVLRALLFCFYFYVDDVQIKSTDDEKLSMGQQWHRLVGASIVFRSLPYMHGFFIFQMRYHVLEIVYGKLFFFILMPLFN
jgi:hypothetical protein